MQLSIKQITLFRYSSFGNVKCELLQTYSLLHKNWLVRMLSML